MSERAIRRIELILTVIGMLGAFFVWVDTRYAHSDVVAVQVGSQSQAISQVQNEVHALYIKMIPEPERIPAFQGSHQ